MASTTDEEGDSRNSPYRKEADTPFYFSSASREKGSTTPRESPSGSSQEQFQSPRPFPKPLLSAAAPKSPAKTHHVPPLPISDSSKVRLTRSLSDNHCSGRSIIRSKIEDSPGRGSATSQRSSRSGRHRHRTTSNLSDVRVSGAADHLQRKFERERRMHEAILEECIRQEKEESLDLDSKFTAVFRMVYPAAWGEEVRVVGSAPGLGSWDVQRASSMLWTTGNVWELEVELPREVIEYKYVLIRGREILRWELLPNRSLRHPPMGIRRQMYNDTWSVESPVAQSMDWMDMSD